MQRLINKKNVYSKNLLNVKSFTKRLMKINQNQSISFKAYVQNIKQYTKLFAKQLQNFSKQTAKVFKENN